MKSLLISIKPKWVVKILKGEKAIEVRKKFPKDYKGWVYIYCTKSSLKVSGYLEMMKTDLSNGKTESTILNGKVVARFYCDKVEEIIDIVSQKYEFDGLCESYGTKTLKTKSLLDKAQLNHLELADYLNDYTPFGYAIHISNLEIFDRPKELSKFYKKGATDYINNCPKRLQFRCNGRGSGLNTINCIKKDDMRLTKAPQSFMFIEVEE